jgi:hypothetical protein
MENDWDNLIVLDACRYDILADINPFSQPVEQRVSLGSNTTEFCRRNFVGKQYHDTVYITANPKGLKIDIPGRYGDHQRTFHATVSLLDEWDSDTHTVMPEDVTRRALELQEEFPDKRLIIHFVQPHLPYLGKKAQQIQSTRNLSIGGWETDTREYTETDAKVEVENVGFDALTDDQYDITPEDFREMYEETLEITLSSVKELVEGLEGKTAITADHGEMFGEHLFSLSWKLYGHPKRKRSDELCLVPWIEFETKKRKRIVAETPVGETDYNEKTIEDRLTALGYK